MRNPKTIIYACEYCHKPILEKGYREGLGILYVCSNPECERFYVFKQGKWYERVKRELKEPLKQIEELKKEI